MQQYAYTATISTDGEEHTRGINKVTITLDPVNSVFFEDGDHAWAPERIQGLPTEDPNEEDELSSSEGFLTCDGAVYYEPSSDEVVYSGMTGFSGYGDPVETRIPADAVKLEWADVSDGIWARHKHEWEPIFGRNILEEDPTLDLIS